MTTQSEQTLEQNLIKQLEGMEYERVQTPDEATMLINLKTQLEKHNKIKFTEKEYERVLNHLNKGNVLDRAKILRDKMRLILDNGKNAYIEFINSREWCQNQFQVTNQIANEGTYKNRYDVTLLINGLPLVQIELKRRGLEMKEAYNQVQRYHKHSYGAGYGLFQYIQIFIISNGVNTKYYANNRNQPFKFTYYWTDRSNQHIRKLQDFAKVFLDKCHIAKMITKYIALNDGDNVLMVLRPYQYYAVEAIIDRVKNNGNPSTTLRAGKNGYIWHTTGSGKTLTSFKASQILEDMPEVHKVVFVVDRNDLDYKTIRDFNAYKAGSVDGSDNTRNLIKQFSDDSTKLIVTTIQKLNNAITREHHEKEMGKLRDKKIIFIFDECHRSQFGETHKRITEFFNNRQMFGFTGTPIFKDNVVGNALGKRTTKDLFDKQLHSYVITDAIKDENVLKFSVEYVGRYKRKDTANEVDIEVEGIDRKELVESPRRLEKIVDYILAHHDNKTHGRDFNAIFAVSSIDVLSKYYDLFKQKNHGLKIATIFSYSANEEDNSLLADDNDIQLSLGELNKHSRDRLESYIGDYNQMFGTKYTTRDSQSFYNYYRDIGKRVENREIDILLVVNMFLTGFDAPRLNTLYVDKNLRYHGLIQAYSRTNRILDEVKSQGNIVVFRNLRNATNDAVRLFADKNAEETIFSQPYDEYLKQFNEATQQLRDLTPTPDDVDLLHGEAQEQEFVTKFRELLRLRNVLVSFADFNINDTTISAQMFNDFRSKYLDIYDKVRSDTALNKASILDDVDFELELIERDVINVDYIVKLLAQMVDTSEQQRDKLKKQIFQIMSGEHQLRSKRELIEKFIQQNIPEIDKSEDVEKVFDSFWTKEKEVAVDKLVAEEGLDKDKFVELVDKYVWSESKPRGEAIVRSLQEQPSVLERESIIKRVTTKFNNFIETFIEGI
jgi:type I restriction enzyme R subunit